MGVPSSRIRGGVARNNICNPPRNTGIRYKRRMFGISFTPYKYQNIISDVLWGCNGVANIADKLIVHEADLKAEHDRNLHAVLQPLREAGE